MASCSMHSLKLQFEPAEKGSSASLLRQIEKNRIYTGEDFWNLAVFLFE